MLVQKNDNQSANGSLDVSRKSIGDNPITAINKLKSIHNNIQMMKNRHLVLKRRDESIQYKTLNQQKKLNHHQAIHQRLTKQREELRKSLQHIKDTKELRERSEEIRKQIKDRTASARKNVYNSNMQKYQLISQQAQKNQQIINNQKQYEMLSARNNASSIKKLRQLQKESFQKKLQDKISRILVSKSIDSGQMLSKSNAGEKLIDQLQKSQMEIIKQASKSMENSKIVSRRFTQIMMNLPSFKPKKTDKSQSEKGSFLPAIKQHNSNNPNLQVIIV